MGRLDFPILVAMAASPMLGASRLSNLWSERHLALLNVLAITNVVTVAGLSTLVRTGQIQTER
jgi:hypothetical protein